MRWLLFYSYHQSKSVSFCLFLIKNYTLKENNNTDASFVPDTCYARRYGNKTFDDYCLTIIYYKNYSGETRFCSHNYMYQLS